MPNVDLLESTMQFIMDHPERHDQSIYLSHPRSIESDCGTAHCFAGWALSQTIDQEQLLVLSKDYWNGQVDSASCLGPIGQTAAKALEISQDDARRLFASFNSREVLQLMVKDLVNGEPLRQADYYMKEARDNA
jgi:hypothetical protein